MPVSMHVFVHMVHMSVCTCVHACMFLLYVVHVHICSCTWHMCLCMRLCLHGCQRTTLDVFFLGPSTLGFLRETFSQDLELADYARLAGQKPQGSICL